MEQRERKHPAHLPNIVRDNRPVIVFVTACAARRGVNTFANETMHRICLNAWASARSHRVGAYVLMPDHLHLFCAPAEPDAENVARWVRYWKALVTRTVRQSATGGACAGLAEVEQTLDPPGGTVFQRDCWDTQLRRGENYHDKWAYVRNNPVRCGLVAHAGEWAYCGVMHDLLW